MSKAELLAAILSDPDDDEARRVYADVLITDGDPRGEFIAMQLAGKPADATPFEGRLRTFGYSARWLWERGFVRALELTSSTRTVDQLRSLLEAEPVVELTMSGDKSATRAQLELPGIERVRRLTVFVENALDIFRPATFASVRELRVGNDIGDKGLALLLNHWTLDKVTHLALGDAGVTDAGLVALAASPLGERLETLEIHRDTITVEMAKRIIAMPRLKTFAYSRGAAGYAKGALLEHFGDRCIRSDGDDEGDAVAAIRDGVERVTYRRLPPH